MSKQEKENLPNRDKSKIINDGKLPDYKSTPPPPKKEEPKKQSGPTAKDGGKKIS